METPEKPINDITNQINQSLQETLTFLKQTGGAAIDFSKEQAPLYVQELLSYNFTISLLFFLFGIALLFIIAPISGYSIYWLSKKENFVTYREYKGPEMREIVFLPIVTLVLSILIGFAVSFSNLEWIKIKMAPRVYLVEEIKKVIQ